MPRDPVFIKRTAASYRSHRQRAEAAGQTLDYSLEDLRELVRTSLMLPCRYCWREMTAATFSCDHKTATSRGGGYELSQIEITCGDCNQAKGVLDAEEFSLLWVALRQMSSESRVNVIRRLRAGARIFAGRR